MDDSAEATQADAIEPMIDYIQGTALVADQQYALAARKVRLTTSAGSNGEPVGQTAIAGLLMLARNFPRWWAAQQKREWKPVRGEAVPRDLRGQTVLVLGMGTVGKTVARFCQLLGMRVIGVRRKPRAPEDPVDEMHTVAALPQLPQLLDHLAFGALAGAALAWRRAQDGAA